MSKVSADPTVVKARTGDMRDAGDQADKSATYIDFRADAQTSGKWGEESGPGDFRNRYTTELDATKVEVMKLKNGLEEFAATMDAIVEGFKGDDNDAAAHLRQAITAATRKVPASTPDGVVRVEAFSLAAVFAPTAAVVAAGAPPTGR